MSLDQELNRILSRLDLPAAARSTLLERFTESLDLIRAGEQGIALENLCDNLVEFEVGITAEVRDQLAGFCRQSGVGEHRRRLLDGLVRRPSPSRDG
jgi:hypothetical protein